MATGYGRNSTYQIHLDQVLQRKLSELAGLRGFFQALMLQSWGPNPNSMCASITSDLEEAGLDPPGTYPSVPLSHRGNSPQYWASLRVTLSFNFLFQNNSKFTGSHRDNVWGGPEHPSSCFSQLTCPHSALI